jgi:hypothetical protein
MAAPLLRARAAIARGDVDRSPGTVSEWLSRYGQHGRVREWLWEPLAVAALNQAPSEAAAAPFVTVLGRMFGSTRRDSAMALPIVPLNETYAEPARRYLEGRGGEVRVNALARVRIEGGRVRGVEVRGEHLPIECAVAAVPWFALAPLLVGDTAPVAGVIAAASAMTSKPIVTINLWYDRTVMDEDFVGLPGREMQWVFDKRLAFGGSASHLSLVSSGAIRLTSMGREELTALAAREVADALPEARRSQLLRATVVREKSATFSLALDQPARPATKTAVDGLYLAGDWIETGLPGTIESAVISGHTAAQELLKAER